MTAPGRKGFGKQLGIVAAVFACSPGPSCADQDTFFPVGERTFLLPCRNASGGSASRRPPKARLRIRRCACICHRQRLAPDSRKATRGSVLWTPRKGGASKGVTRVAARAVRRGLIPRIPLTLNRTSDRDFAPPQPAARRNTNSKINTRHCEPVRRLVWCTPCGCNPHFGRMISAPTDAIRDHCLRQHRGRRGDPAWILYQMCTVFGIRANDLTLCKMLPAFGVLFSLESKNRFSFRARSKREMGLALRRSSSANSQTPMKGKKRPAGAGRSVRCVTRVCRGRGASRP